MYRDYQARTHTHTSAHAHISTRARTHRCQHTSAHMHTRTDVSAHTHARTHTTKLRPACWPARLPPQTSSKVATFQALPLLQGPHSACETPDPQVACSPVPSRDPVSVDPNDSPSQGRLGEEPGTSLCGFSVDGSTSLRALRALQPPLPSASCTVLSYVTFTPVSADFSDVLVGF